MSRFFPHTAYAEDQPLYHTVLTAHVLYRGFQAGAVAGTVIGVVTLFVKSSKLPAWLALQRSAGVGSLFGIGAMMVALPLRMFDKTEIEWKDRSWRLLENQGQLAVDDWSLPGTALLPIFMYLQNREGAQLGWRIAMGRAGIGSMAGIAGYLFWSRLVKGQTS
ncbi:hypothetical protein V1525DRAFT_410167 [Lipomyces kononenkoae]|uniref:Uncharacterized protein n=1 Tax=Lipomyces kononenkoae TaxID=34357 RepID=A0ACC3SVD9_LIPKO